MSLRRTADRLMRAGASLLLAACATAPGPAARSADGPAGDADAQVRLAPERFLVLAVANPGEAIAVGAGSTPGRYGLQRVYTPGDGARSAVAGIALRYGLREVAAWPIDALRWHCALLEVPPGASRESLAARLQDDPQVRLVQPLQTFETLTGAASYDDPYLELQTGFAALEAARAQRLTRGQGVRVAVIDTGIDTAHPDLGGRVTRTRNLVDRDATGFLRDRHGTQVAGIIGAVANNGRGIVGIAPEAQLIALKACWQPAAATGLRGGAQCNSFTLAQALAAAFDTGAQVINLSLGGPPDPLLAALVRQALKRGIVVVGAVPPGGRLDGFPVGIPGVIAVDIAEADPNVAQPPTAGVLYAPGRDVLTLLPDGHYDFASGASLAAAHVSAAAALLLAVDPRLDGPAVHALLERSAWQPVVDNGPPTRRSIDACTALAALRRRADCDAADTVAAQAALH